MRLITVHHIIAIVLTASCMMEAELYIYINQINQHLSKCYQRSQLAESKQLKTQQYARTITHPTRHIRALGWSYMS